MKLSKVDITNIVIVFIAFLVKFLHPRSVSFIQMVYVLLQRDDNIVTNMWRSVTFSAGPGNQCGGDGQGGTQCKSDCCPALEGSRPFYAQL